MNSAEVARRFAGSRSGFTLVGFGAVGIPFYRLSLRAQVLERKPVPPMEEIVMLALDSGLEERETIRGLLGLDPDLFDVILAELLRKEEIAIRGIGDRGNLQLAPAGREVLDLAREISPADRPLEVHYDALLREVVPYVAGLIDARRVDSLGLREIPPATARPPELGALDPEAVQRAVMEVPRADAVTADLLALRRIERRTRTFREATLLVYRSDERKEVQIALVIDGEISEAHGAAFSKARLSTKSGVRASAMEDPAELFQAVLGRDPVPRETAPGGESRYRDFETVDCFDLPGRLAQALDEPCKRIVLISPRLTEKSLTSDLLESLRQRLVGGTEITIGIGPEARSPAERDLERKPWRQLDELFRGYSNLTLRRLHRPGPAMLVIDRGQAILTRLNWLAYEGDPSRTFVDERGVLLSDVNLIDRLAAEALARFSDR